MGIDLNDTTTLSVATFIRSANIYHQKGAYWAWKNSSEWNFDDSNASTQPIATTALVAAQEDYSLPSTALDVVRVEVLDVNGNYVLVKEINKEDIGQATSEFYETDGLPIYWYREGNSLILKPAPSTSQCTLADGLKIYLTREVTDFGLTATATEPSFPAAFHRLCSIGPAIDKARIDFPSMLNGFYAEYTEIKKDFEGYYAKRSKSNKPIIKGRRLDTI